MRACHRGGPCLENFVRQSTPTTDQMIQGNMPRIIPELAGTSGREMPPFPAVLLAIARTLFDEEDLRCESYPC
jgi:hypothetical protein